MTFILYTSLLNSRYFTVVFVTFWVTVLLAACTGIARLLNPAFPLHCQVHHRDRVLIGLLQAISRLLIAYSTIPQRLPVFLHQLLSATLVLFTGFIRFCLLRRSLSRYVFLCIVCVLVAFVVSIEPVIFDHDIKGGLPGLRKRSKGTDDAEHRAAWSLLFLGGVCFVAFVFVLEERAFKAKVHGADGHQTLRDVNVLVFLVWIELWTLVFLLICFFADIIPFFGQSDNVDAFGHRIRDSFKCMFGSGANTSDVAHLASISLKGISSTATDCHDVILRGWLLVAFSVITSLFSVLLLKFSNGAVYLATVQLLPTPLCAFFWTLFEIDEMAAFSWHPVFYDSTIYVIVGFLISVVGVVLYNYFWRKEMKAAGS